MGAAVKREGECADDVERAQLMGGDGKSANWKETELCEERKRTDQRMEWRDGGRCRSGRGSNRAWDNVDLEAAEHDLAANTGWYESGEEV